MKTLTYIIFFLIFSLAMYLANNWQLPRIFLTSAIATIVYIILTELWKKYIKNNNT